MTIQNPVLLVEGFSEQVGHGAPLMIFEDGLRHKRSSYPQNARLPERR